jgi:regulatory protein
MNQERQYSFLEIKHKIEHWCAYSDRCHKDVFEKLRNYGLDMEDTNALIAHLIEYSFLDEQRFADSFVSGKYRIKKWGRKKITAHLKQKDVPVVCIKSALESINLETYQKNLEKLAFNKWQEKTGTTFEKRVKVQRFLAGKGYEYDLINNVLDDLISQIND